MPVGTKFVSLEKRDRYKWGGENVLLLHDFDQNYRPGNSSQVDRGEKDDFLISHTKYSRVV
jgi:hypothetical protein